MSDLKGSGSETQIEVHVTKLRFPDTSRQSVRFVVFRRRQPSRSPRAAAYRQQNPDQIIFAGRSARISLSTLSDGVALQALPLRAVREGNVLAFRVSGQGRWQTLQQPRICKARLAPRDVLTLKRCAIR